MATTEQNALIRAKDVEGNSSIIYPITKAENVDGLEESLAGKSDTSHTHNDTYYTEMEIDSKLAEISSSIAGKSDTNHEHDDKYYTEDEIDSKIDTLNTAISSKADSTHQHTGITDGDNSAIMQDHALLPMVGNGVLTTASAPTTVDTPEINLGSLGNTWGTAYVNEVYIKNAGDYLTEILKSKASDSAISSSIYSHNSSTSAHSDIRSLIDGLTSRLNALADSDDTTLDQLSEIVEYIKSNRSLIENVTTNKLNVSDVIDNLTTNVSNKALSANQGVAIKALIDALQSEFDGHTHAISEVTGLQSALDGKAGVSHGTHVTYSTEDPIMDGTAYAGSTSAVARSNHRHPTDTTRAAKADLDSHTSNTTVHITSTERTNWNAAKTHADSAHAPSNAEKNQNAFSNIVVGSTTVAADTATDTLTLAGSNVTLTPDATNDKITFSVADGSTSAKGILQLTDSTSSTSTTTAATPKSVKLAYDLASTAQDMADMAQSTADGKANASHTHTIANVTNLQNSLNAKQATVTGGASTITSSNLTTDRVLVSNSSGKVAVSDVTSTELGYLSGITNDIQAQLDGKASSAHTHKYAGSSSAGGAATSANKLNTDAGDSNTPVYFSNGVPVACTSLDLNTTGSSASCTGNAATATKATQDGSGNVIADTYMTKADPTGTGSFSLNRTDGSTVGDYSIAAGNYAISTGISTIALGWNPQATANYATAIGTGAKSTASGGTALGWYTKTSGLYSTAAGYKTTASGEGSTALGYNTIASGKYSIAVGYGESTEDAPDGAIGEASVAIGRATYASGDYSIALGCDSIASGKYSIALGENSNAAAANSLCFGYSSNTFNQVGPDDTTSSGNHGTAFSLGYMTRGYEYQGVLGRCNTKIAGPATGSTQDSTNSDALLVVGYGAGNFARANAFRITSGGKCYGATAFGASGADFAELFEWADGNPDNEDRRGLFVALDGEKIRIANEGDDYIGVISGAQAFIGNTASDEWQGKYLTDVFGDRISQEVEIPEVVNEETGEVITPAAKATQYVLNPDYDPDEKYAMRENRKEWGIVGLLGQIVMIDDGSCVVGGHVKPSANGIGTASDSGYRVMKRVDENHIKVLVR